MSSTNQGSVTYVDDQGNHVYVSDGIASGAYYFTVRRDPFKRKGEKRITSPALPHRKTIKEAEDDLVTYAKKKGWRLMGKGERTQLTALTGRNPDKKSKPPAYVPRSQLGLL